DLFDPATLLNPSDTRNIYAPVPHVALNFHDGARNIWVDVKFAYIKYSGSKAQKWRFESGYKVTQGTGIVAGWHSYSGLWFKDRAPAPDDHIQIRFQEYYAGIFLSF